MAGGTGSRMGAEVPKQFLTVEERCLIEYTIDAFEQNESVDEICVVVHPEWVTHMRFVVSCNEWTKFGRIVAGGSERYMSTLEAIKAYADHPDETKFLLHDAVRPMVSQQLISGVAAALDECEAAGAAVACTDTIWRVSDGVIDRIPERSSLMRAQTPQGFRLGVIREAYRRAVEEVSVPVTDDCGMVHRYLPEVEIHVVEGDERNIKVTYPRDLELFKQSIRHEQR